VETSRAFEIDEVRARLREFSGLELQDDPARSNYPLGIRSQGGDTVAVGRLRRDASVNKGLNFWVVSDNLRKGAALNAVQVAEVILQAVR
jgi:aspartate-semialdehyde dehydrogenase